MMYRQSGLKTIISSFVLSITLTFGMASIGYCGGAAEPPGDDERYSGPPIHGTLVIIGGDDDDLITLPDGVTTRIHAVQFLFEGSCGSNQDIFACADVSANNYWVPENKAEMKDTRFPNGQSKIIIADCHPATNPTGNDPLTVAKVLTFGKCDNADGKAKYVTADVRLMWIVPK